MLSAILFDLDGTLVHSDPIHFTAWQNVLQKFNLVIDLEFYRRKISGRTNAAIIRDILPELSPEEAERLAEAKEIEFRNLCRQLAPLPGLSDLLSWTKQHNLKQAIVTNAPPANAQFFLEKLNLTDSFPVVVLAEDAPPGKPHPAPYLLALQRLGVKNSEAIVFEDSPSGIQAAIQAGIYTIGVTSTHSASTLLDMGVAMTINDFRDERLWERLNKLLTNPLPCSLVN